MPDYDTRSQEGGVEIILILPQGDSQVRYEVNDDHSEVIWARTAYSEGPCQGIDCDDYCPGPHPDECEVCKQLILDEQFYVCMDDGSVTAHKGCVTLIRAEIVLASEVRNGDLVSTDEDAVDALNPHYRDMKPEDMNWSLLYHDARKVFNVFRYGGWTKWSFMEGEETLGTKQPDEARGVRFIEG